MSSHSYAQDCPRCMGKETMMVVTDTRPFNSTAAECLRCGFEYHSELYVMDKETLDARRQDYDYELEHGSMTREQMENMKHFDEDYKPKNLEEDNAR